MSTIVVSQPMVFPWVGLLEQVRLADVFVHYDDVQFPQGRSFSSRVQIKSVNGPQWLTIPVLRKSGQLIRDVIVDDGRDWRANHLANLQQCYSRAPYVKDMLAIVREAYALKTNRLSEINIAGLELLASYFGLKTRFLVASHHPAEGSSSQRLLWWVKQLGGKTYVTGHGAFHYLNHDLFEQSDIRVEYMEYQKARYPQLHGEFTPFVSSLDLVANAGPAGAEFIRSGTRHWREFSVAAG